MTLIFLQFTSQLCDESNSLVLPYIYKSKQINVKIGTPFPLRHRNSRRTLPRYLRFSSSLPSRGRGRGPSKSSVLSASLEPMPRRPSFSLPRRVSSGIAGPLEENPLRHYGLWLHLMVWKGGEASLSIHTARALPYYTANTA